MKKYKYLIIVLAVAVILGVGGLLAYAGGNDKETAPSQNSSSQSSVSEAKITISQDKKTVVYEGQTGKTALAILKSLTTVTTQQSDYGEFVTGINGVEAVSGKQFWAFYVNGVMASEGAGTYKSTTGQKIEWKMEDIKL